MLNYITWNLVNYRILSYFSNAGMPLLSDEFSVFNGNIPQVKQRHFTLNALQNHTAE